MCRGGRAILAAAGFQPAAPQGRREDKAIMIRIRTLIVWALSASSVWAADPLPHPDAPFQGKIVPSRDKPNPVWPQPPPPPKGAPNAVLILLDDVSCGAPSTFGGPVATPFLT